MDRLTEIGFEHVGRWQLSDTRLSLSLHRMADVSPALYAFAIDGEIKYVGKTMRPLGQRLYGYLNPGKSQRTNQRVRTEILNALRTNPEVLVLAFVDATVQHVGRFRLNIAAALEDDIIAQVRPPWNGGREISEALAKSDTTGIVPCAQSSTPPTANSQATIENPQPKSTSPCPTFGLVIGKTYYRQGFFNVPVALAQHFGKHGEVIVVHCAGLPHPIQASINRTANTTFAPRVMGGAALRDWFQHALRQGQEVRVVIDSPTVIRLAKC